MAETAAYALGPPPTWARDGSSASSPLDGADMLEEGWSYLRRLFTICFEVTEGESLHVGVEEVGLLLRTILPPLVLSRAWPLLCSTFPSPRWSASSVLSKARTSPWRR